MMNKLRSSPAWWSAVAAVGAFTACGGSQPPASSPTNPTNAQATASMVSYGSNAADGFNASPTGASTSSVAAKPGSEPGMPTAHASPSSPAPVTWGSGAAAPEGTTSSASGGTAATSSATTSVDDRPGQAGAKNTTTGLPEPLGLNDAQIAAVVASITDGQMRQAQVAAMKGYSASVRRFAEHMIVAHRAIADRDALVLSRERIRATDNAVSNQVKTDALDQLSALQSVHGRDFDREYIDGQVRDDDGVLKLLDRIALSVKNPDLKWALQAARTQVDDQLRMAKKVQRELQTGVVAAP